MHHVTRVLPLLLATFYLCACVNLPINNDAIDDPALQEISKAFNKTVEAAHNDPHNEWQSGWVGNMWVHFRGEEQRGLCYEWKYLVHAGVADTVERVGWQVRGIAVNEHTPNEHHAVLVFDPERVNSTNILTATSDKPVYVLDAWRQGQADIYPIATWLNSNFKTAKPARIFVIDAVRHSRK